VYEQHSASALLDSLIETIWVWYKIITTEDVGMDRPRYDRSPHKMKLISGTGWISCNPALQVPAVSSSCQSPVVSTPHERARFRCVSGEFYGKGDSSTTDLVGNCTADRWRYVTQ
jgi:hypothetical protein